MPDDDGGPERGRPPLHGVVPRGEGPVGRVCAFSGGKDRGLRCASPKQGRRGILLILATCRHSEPLTVDSIIVLIALRFIYRVGSKMSEGEITPSTWISKVSVRGLHGRLDFDVHLQSGINVIYGKNGLGKTTLLHIIANATELQFDLFEKLNFNEIEISSSDDQKLKISRSSDDVTIFINDEITSFSQGRTELSEVERNAVASIVGERSTYLPAFRSILERMREQSSPYLQEERSTSNFEKLVEMEVQVLRNVAASDPYYRRSYDLARTNILKTLRCRQWFGAFVPTIRYPSIVDVIDGLSDEWERAQLSVGQAEQKQFETAFVEIFSAIASGTESDLGLTRAELLNRIRSLVIHDSDNEDYIGPASNVTYEKLVAASDATKENDTQYNHLLQIYVDTLHSRKDRREALFKPLNEFRNSVNEFLTEKALEIKTRFDLKVSPRRRAAPQINPSEGQPYNLTALSSGERQIVTMLYSASRAHFRNGCLLIDEPELSLHVDWQRIIIQHLSRQHSGRQIIACTHSPEVGADHEERVQFFKPTICARDSSFGIDSEDA